MASKLVLAELRCHVLKRPHKKGSSNTNSNNPGSVASREPVFTLALDPAIPKVNPSKNQKGKKTMKGKNIVQVDPDDSTTLEGKSEFYGLAKDFPYPEFMDKELMTPTLLKHLQSNDDSLAYKF